MAAVVGTQLPDLIDKPLAWALSVIQTGYGPGHSLVVAIPLLTGVMIVTRRMGRFEYGVATTVGYASHLLSDIGYAIVVGSDVVWGRVLWPFGPSGGYAVDRGFVGRFLEYFIPFVEAILSGEATGYLIVYLTLFGGVFVLWVYDGYPVLRDLLRYLGGSTRRNP